MCCRYPRTPHTKTTRSTHIHGIHAHCACNVCGSWVCRAAHRQSDGHGRPIDGRRWAHVLCLEVILKKKTFFKSRVQTHDLGHMTEAMVATAQHNHLTRCPLTTSNIILDIACHGSASRQHKMIFPSKWYIHPN